jgi:signal transduction histidine kinase
LPSPSGVTKSVLGSPEGYVIVDDVENPPPNVDVRPNEGFLAQINVRSFLAVALRVGAGFVAEDKGDKETVGVLYIDFLSPHDFKKEEIDVAQMFANYAATAIAASRVHAHKVQMEKLGAISAFGARFAHRVGNLLGTVPVNFKAVELLLDGTIDDTLGQHMSLLRKDVQKIQRLLHASRNLRKSESSEKELVMVNDLLREVAEQHILPTNVELVFELDNRAPALTASKSVLTDVISDMIDNARYAMENSGGRLTIATKLHPQNNLLEIKVSDTGCGIAPEVRNRLREPFFTTKEANLGLGVWLCDQSVQQMGGKLIIESEVNVGTSFIIQLPV